MVWNVCLCWQNVFIAILEMSVICQFVHVRNEHHGNHRRNTSISEMILENWKRKNIQCTPRWQKEKKHGTMHACGCKNLRCIARACDFRRSVLKENGRVYCLSQQIHFSVFHRADFVGLRYNNVQLVSHKLFEIEPTTASRHDNESDALTFVPRSNCKNSIDPS